MTIETRKISEIRPYEQNAKIHGKEQISNVAKSIKKYGWQGFILIDSDNVIIAGHCRYFAAKRLGLKEVPVKVADELTEEQVREYRLLDNKLNESEWDLDILKDDLLGLDFSDFKLDWGIGDEEEDEAETEEDDFDEPLPEEPISKQGDVWQLGDHRLMCGDSTNADDVEKLMGRQLADLVITDPPYNVDYEGKTKDKLKIDNDKMEQSTFEAFLIDAFSNLKTALKPGGTFYVWHASKTQREFEDALNANELEVRQQLIWNKNSMVLGRQDYQWKHEPCFYGWKEGAAHYFIDDRTNTTVFDEKKPVRNAIHPTMKPIKLIAKQVQNSSRKGELVLDLFGDSGSTLMACEQTGRKCCTMEFDPRYCDAIIERWQSYTGRKAELIE